MPRPVLGLILGGLIGLFDGATALATAPEFRVQIAGIVIGSAFKGLIAGLVTGVIVRKTGSMARGLLIGLFVALLLALPVAYMNATHYEDASIYWKIILPGAVTGAIVGYGTVRFGKRAVRSAA